MKLLAAVFSMMFLTIAFGQVSHFEHSDIRLSPRLMNYQGYLTDTMGIPITNPSVSMTFSIFDALSSGNQKWTETQSTVGVDKGIFHVLLGGGTPIPDSVFKAGADRWLELSVAGQTLAPRTRIVSVPFAYTATYSDTALYAINAVADNDWNFRVTDGADTTLQMGGRWGITRFGNTMYGNADSTHTNFGVACTTGAFGQNRKYCTVGGGFTNKASSGYATVGGGVGNIASGYWGTVGGGNTNSASGQYTTAGGGYQNSASGNHATVGGGYGNYAVGPQSIVGGGYYNGASNQFATVGGGQYNFANGYVATISGGELNAASGEYTTVSGGSSSFASGNYATVGGGQSNTASGGIATVGGGVGNTASGHLSTVAGGQNNTTADSFNFIGGGHLNRTEGKYSVIPGGYADTIFATGDYSYLFGINSNLTQDSTFMVDMPHVWFGTEANGYEFPRSRGTIGQALVTNGSGQVSWGSTDDNDWSFLVSDGADTTLQMGGRWGLTRPGNVLYGNADSTHVNLGVVCTTGTVGNDFRFSTVSGGFYNTAGGHSSTVSGGEFNTASGWGATVDGGRLNRASGYISTVGGGHFNKARGQYSVICGGGGSNEADSNSAIGNYSAIGGGYRNIASGLTTVIGGGYNNVASSEKAVISGGQGNTASGTLATVSGGQNNTASGWITTIGGGDANTASGYNATVGGGNWNVAGSEMATIAGGLQNNAGYYATVGGGRRNNASTNYTTIGGGYYNLVSGQYSAILGGYADTITATGHYSYLFGINSNLTQDSTFMVDLPHVWFGTESNGYEFPYGRGADGQVMRTNGSGILSWGSIAYVDSARVAENAHKLQGQDTIALDARWVNEGQVNSIDSLMLQNNAVTMPKIAQAGALTGQVIKWNGTAWQPATDSSMDSDWSFLVSDGADTTLQTGGQWGIARAGNTLYGNADSTHVNLGVGSTTGANGQNYKYVTVGGGYGNTANYNWATVSGGDRNTAGLSYATVSGGALNNAGGQCATIGGGSTNVAASECATVAGGNVNSASNYNATVGGGQGNIASGYIATVGGGKVNRARGAYSVICGGGGSNEADSNSAIGNYSAIGGGYRNIAVGNSAVIGGGYGNKTSVNAATIGGGGDNTANGDRATVGGGNANNAGNQFVTIGGGTGNNASGNTATVGGGNTNTASGEYATVGGGVGNTASGNFTVVGGGWSNTASGNGAIVTGGYYNSNAGDWSAILGGYADTITATGHYSYLFGINSNLTQDSTFMVDLPHIRFGTEAAGYEFPVADGSSGQALVTDGSGQVSWGTPSDINRIISAYTPSSSSDPYGNVGDMTLDDSYVYFKTSTGWKRSALTNW